MQSPGSTQLRWIQTRPEPVATLAVLGSGVATTAGILHPADGSVLLDGPLACVGDGPAGVDVIGRRGADGEGILFEAVDERTGQPTGLVIGGAAAGTVGRASGSCGIRGGQGDVVLVTTSFTSSDSLVPRRQAIAYQVADGAATQLHAATIVSCPPSGAVYSAEAPAISGAYLVGAGSTCPGRVLQAHDLRTGGLVAELDIGLGRVVALDDGPRPGDQSLAQALVHDGDVIQLHALHVLGGTPQWIGQWAHAGTLVAVGEDVAGIRPPGSDLVALVDLRTIDGQVRAMADPGVPRDRVRQHVVDDAGRLLTVADEPATLTVVAPDGASLWTVDFSSVLGGPVSGVRIDHVGLDGAVYVSGRVDLGDDPSWFVARLDDGGPVEPPGVLRLHDPTDAVDLAVDVCRRVAPTPASAARVVIARDDVFADALAGSALAGPDGCVLFQSGGASLDRRTLFEAVRVLPAGGRVYLLGGSAAIAHEAEADLVDTGFDVVRLAGDERTATAAAVAREVTATREPTVPGTAYLATAEAFPDAVTAGAHAAAAGIPLLLTAPDALSPATATVLEDLGITRTVVLGGEAAISDAVLAQVPGPERVAGDTRYGTAAAIARELWAPDDIEGAQLVAVDAAGSWRAASAAGPLAAARGTPQIGVAAATATPDSLVALGRVGGRRGAAADGRGRIAGRHVGGGRAGGHRHPLSAPPMIVT
ncbi:cell wall-binding repeat-containing protein [Euzebya sp.]|uniref:cell wall-binding repeat-containing protein n=1 Tax=Euzebya sp. TaxID=1971409 RepID=UPI0035143F6E